jgi:hypothetical protein
MARIYKFEIGLLNFFIRVNQRYQWEGLDFCVWPEVELELWKFISFPVSGRQFLLISGSTPSCGA